MIDRLRTRLAAQDGFTLIELLAATALLAVVITVAGGIFVTALKAQQTVSAVTGSANTAQLIASTIDNRIRNSSEFQLSNPSGNDQMLVARVAGTGAVVDWKCFGWYYSAAGAGSLRMTTTTPGTKITAPTSTQLASWTLLSSAVSPRSGTSIFTTSGTRLTISFNTTVTGQQPTAIQLTTARLTGATGAGTCY